MLASKDYRDEARAMLAEVYNWFTEGFDTADLKQAKGAARRTESVENCRYRLLAFERELVPISAQVDLHAQRALGLALRCNTTSSASAAAAKGISGLCAPSPT
jgi:hypothetical protein